VLGKVTRRKDGVARVTGQEQYSVDISLPRMLHGRIVSSPYAHARIKSVDVSGAIAMGAVTITFDDIPHVLYNERIVTVQRLCTRTITCWPTKSGAWAKPSLPSQRRPKNWPSAPRAPSRLSTSRSQLSPIDCGDAAGRRAAL